MKTSSSVCVSVVATNPIRAERFLSTCLPGYSRSSLACVFRKGWVTVNGKACRKGDVLTFQDCITLPLLPATPEIPLADSKVPVCKVFEDDFLLIVDKPSGQPSHPLFPWEKATCVNGLVGVMPSLRDVGRNPLESGLIMRLDTETSGLLLIAKTNACFEQLKQMQTADEIRKTYLAVVHGTFKQDMTLSWPIKQNVGRGKVRVLKTDMENGVSWPAVTDVKVLSTNNEVSLISATIHRGKMHQIRAHLSAAGHPIVGDSKYGSDDSKKASLFLHAWQLHFNHPQTKQTLNVTSRPPVRFIDSFPSLLSNLESFESPQ